MRAGRGCDAESPQRDRRALGEFGLLASLCQLWIRTGVDHHCCIAARDAPQVPVLPADLVWGHVPLPHVVPAVHAERAGVLLCVDRMLGCRWCNAVILEDGPTS